MDDVLLREMYMYSVQIGAGPASMQRSSRLPDFDLLTWVRQAEERHENLDGQDGASSGDKEAPNLSAKLHVRDRLPRKHNSCVRRCSDVF